jgi:hypothetical protein
MLAVLTPFLALAILVSINTAGIRNNEVLLLLLTLSSRHPMKAKVTTNLTSIVMLVVLTPFLALTILVSIQTAGIRNNELLLLMLTLSSAVLSGINGFGRRTSTAVPFSTAKTVSDTRLHLSARSSNNA